MSYSLKIKKSAKKSLARITKPDRLRLIQAIDQLLENPLSGKPLQGSLEGLRRLRVGKYRIVYDLMQHRLVILVVRIGHRKDVYR